MNNVFFTIIIPTRNGSETIIPTINTILEQSFDDFEIIISVNHSSKKNKTLTILKKIKDKRIRIYCTGRDLSMTENWEYAIKKKINGSYITYIGDDDGFTKDALKKAYNIINKNKIKVLTWGLCGEYFWPNTKNSEANFLYIKSPGNLICKDTSEIINDVVNFRLPYTNLPMIYNSFVQKKIILNFKKKNNNFFWSRTPDVFSGFVIASQVKKFYLLNYPIQIAGVSQKSNGNSFFHKSRNFTTASKDFRNLKNISFEKNLVYAPSFPILTMESFLKARNKINYLKKFKINLKKMIYESVIENKYHPQRVQREVNLALKKISNINLLSDWFDFLKKRINKNPNLKPKELKNLLRCHYVLNLKKKKINNVLDMVRYVDTSNILKNKQSFLLTTIYNLFDLSKLFYREIIYLKTKINFNVIKNNHNRK